MAATISGPAVERETDAGGALSRPTPKPKRAAKAEAQTARVRALVLSGYGLNCDYETEYVFRLAGAEPQRVHINALIAEPALLQQFHILACIGGFAWADDHGAGVILATKLRHHLGEELLRFVDTGRFVIGICNGFQALVNLGLLPGFEAGTFRREVALTHNDCHNYRDQWVHLRVEDTRCVATRGLRQIELPVRHAEGKFVASAETLARLERGKQIVLRYATPDCTCANGVFPWNPNGSLEDIAGICDPRGRVFGLMPHPEAYNHYTNHPDWTRWAWGAGERHLMDLTAASSEEGDGVMLFRNIVREAARSFHIPLPNNDGA
jgi:phosphoribosylformylglycinamidine synthase subunit PurQ / glutaminase